MKVGFVYDPIYLQHDTGQHVEGARRLEAIISHLEQTGLKQRLSYIQPRAATTEEISLVHHKQYIEHIGEVAQKGGGWLDADTVMSPRSYEAARYAVGGVIRATEAVMDGEVGSAFALVRPPGHHATGAQTNGGQGQILINIEPGDTRKRHFSLAFDIGTTGVRGQLLDINRGKVQAEGLDYNGQISYGEDVISRIAYSQKPNGLKKLQRAVVATINGIISKLLAESKVKVEDVAHITVAGNTTMIQLFLGLDPKYLRLAPYTPTVNTVPLVRATSLGLEVAEHANVYALPSVASYVGADIVSGILGSGVYQRKKLTLYMDIGTNGEIVIGHSDWMVTASCSAGPAFEGGGVRHGMLAAEGAIEGFDINPSNFEPVITTIGGVKPKGICGSGLINITAGLLEAGVIGQNGRFPPQWSHSCLWQWGADRAQGWW